MVYMSYNVFPCKDVPFGVSLIPLFIYGFKCCCCCSCCCSRTHTYCGHQSSIICFLQWLIQ